LSQKETITEFTCRYKVVTGTVRLKDYNYRTPSLDLTAEETNPDLPGTLYEYGNHYKDNPEGNFLAQVRSQEINAHSRIFKGKSDCRLFHAGSIYKMGRHYVDEWNETEYLLTKVKSRGTQRSLFNLIPDPRKVEPTYQNSFEAIPSDTDYRPPRITPVPKVPGIMNAKVESGSEDEYAFVDDEGRYKVKIPFDLSDAGNGEASRALRLLQPYSGPDYGIHFPNHAETELVWSCINGDVDRPMGVGTVPNPSQSSPVTSGNKQKSIIRTAAGNEIILDDKTDEYQIIIRTPDSNVLLFDDKDDKIELTTKDKHKATFDDKNKKIAVKTKDGHEFVMDDKNKKITLKSKKGHFMTVNDGDGNERITLSDKDKKNYFVIDITNDKLVIKTADGSIDMHAPNGKIDLKAQTLNVETSGKTKFKSDASYSIQSGGKYSLNAGGDIEAKTDTNLKVEATNAAGIKATELKSESSGNTEIIAHAEIKLMGDASASMTAHGGSSRAVLSGTSASLMGDTVNVEASGPNSIKGSPVMLNCSN
jgi:type VI secretion system secreted protein VgrG